MATAAAVAPFTGLRRAAIFLVQLGKERAAKLMAMLPEQMLEELAVEIATLSDIPDTDADDVFGHAHGQLMVADGARGGMNLARQLLAESLGGSRASEIMEKLGASLADVPFESIRRADPRQLLTFLDGEHPQMIALVLAHLAPQQSATVLGGLETELQADVAHRIASMEPASPDVIRLVERELERRMTTVLGREEMSSVGGIAPLVAIINRADRGTERMILEGLAGIDANLAETVRAQMFIFEDILALEDKAIQLVLKSAQMSDLALALKGVSEEVKNKITKNLSSRAAENLVEEIELLGAVRLTQVEEAQAKVVQEIRSLEQSGQIMIMRGGDEEMVV